MNNVSNILDTHCLHANNILYKKHEKPIREYGFEVLKWVTFLFLLKYDVVLKQLVQPIKHANSTHNLENNQQHQKFNTCHI